MAEDLAGFRIHKVHQFTCEAGHGNMTVMINRFLFGWVALNTKAGVRAAIEKRNHPVCIIRVTSNRSAR